MSAKLLIGLDGSGSGDRALAYASGLAKLIGECQLVVCYVIEWSPYTFQTPEENEERHKRREEEIAVAKARVVEPAVVRLAAEGFDAVPVVRHGDVADTLIRTATDMGCDQIVVARSSDAGFVQRLLGTSTANLVMTAPVPVTVVA